MRTRGQSRRLCTFFISFFSPSFLIPISLHCYLPYLVPYPAYPYRTHAQSTNTNTNRYPHSRKAAMTAHPDKGGSEAKMAAVNEAYEVLNNPGTPHFFLPLPLPLLTLPAHTQNSVNASTTAMTPTTSRLAKAGTHIRSRGARAGIRLRSSSRRSRGMGVGSSSILVTGESGWWWLIGVYITS